MATRTLLDVVRLSTTYLTDHGSVSARLEAELLSAHALDLRRLDLYLQFDRTLKDAELESIRELLRRRARGEPVAYITGEREFFGRAFEVTADVLVPRPETETLVERALRHVREADNAAGLQVADLGTGSGCIAVTLAAEVPLLRVLATDVSDAALTVATRNAGRHGVQQRVVASRTSWADALSTDLDLVVSNPPYVTTAELAEADVDVRDFEPAVALLGGDDGLDAYRALLASLRGKIQHRGRLLLEVDPRRATAVAGLVEAAHPGSQSAVLPDLAGRPRVVDVLIE